MARCQRDDVVMKFDCPPGTLFMAIAIQSCTIRSQLTPRKERVAAPTFLTRVHQSCQEVTSHKNAELASFHVSFYKFSSSLVKGRGAH